jgi:hypothetical protein
MLQTRFSSKLIGKGLTLLLHIKMELGGHFGWCVSPPWRTPVFPPGYIRPYLEQGPLLIKGSGLDYRGGIPRLAYPQETTTFANVKQIQLTRPELAFIIVTRAMIGAGIALLLADRLSAEQRKAVGATLATVGLVTTIPAVWAIFGKCE